MGFTEAVVAHERFLTSEKLAPTCPVGELLHLLSDTDSESFQGLLDSDVYGTRIALFLNENSDQAAKESKDQERVLVLCTQMKPFKIQRHRLNQCSCSKVVR